LASEGSLTVVGIGIELGSHVTRAAGAEIEAAEVVFTLVADPASLAWLETLNRDVRSLHGRYRLGEDRLAAYEAMVEEVVAEVIAERRVCLALYGHPGVFVIPSHEAIRRVRAAGLPARMLPAVSAEDCLFADLGVDPAASGCQSYEATGFLLRRPVFDTTAALVLWQVGTVGSAEAAAEPRPTGLPLLVEALLEHYPADHEVVVYEASALPGFPPLIDRLALGDLVTGRVTALATLYVPPLGERETDATTLDRLGLPE
jgi:uncharacterized protein YabN with tetrapyrrole methylase and pyrophosphatase domain